MFRVILGMSTDLKNVKDRIRSVARPLDEHLIKLALFPDNESAEHWRSEIYSFLSGVPKLKGTNKFPKASVIYNEISIYEDMLDVMIDVVKRNYKSLQPAQTSDAEIISKVEAYHMWLADALSTHGLLSTDEVIDELAKLNL